MLRVLVLFALIGIAPQSESVTTLAIAGRSNANPSVAAAGDVVAVAWGATLSGGKTDVFVAVSRDGGSTFGAPRQVNKVQGEARLGGEMPPRVSLVPRRGASVPDIVVLWTARTGTTQIKMARSGDGGKTFGAEKVLESPSAGGDRGWPSLATDAAGGAHAIWLDHRGLAANREAGAGHTGHAAGASHDGAAMAQKSALYYASSTGGREHEVAKGVCYCCKTALAIDGAGTIYTAWRHVYPGNLRDMAFSVSRDKGRTFSTPVRVSEDGWSINGCPDDGPALAVDAQNVVHMVWPTVVNDGSPQGALFYTSTRDGRRFTTRVRIPTLGGPRPTHPQVAVANGRVFVAWDEIVNGRRTAAIREVRPQASGISFGEVMSLASDAKYPVLTGTTKGLLAVWTQGDDDSRIGSRLLQ